MTPWSNLLSIQDGAGLFGVDQEAEVTLTLVNTGAAEKDLLFNVQSNPTPEFVSDAINQAVRVETLLPQSHAVDVLLKHVHDTR